LLTPTVLPAVLGDQWKPIVVTFQILLVVGVGHAIVNCIGEALSGNGHIEFRAKAMVLRCAATLLALLILVPVAGIRGAALAQLLVFLPYAVVYCTAGARRAGTSGAVLGRQLRPVGSALLAQLATSGAVLWTLSAFTVTGPIAVCAAAAAGLVVCGALLYWFGIRKRQL
jgi:O-antigen/teichoic acid export membrane protein